MTVGARSSGGHWCLAAWEAYSPKEPGGAGGGREGGTTAVGMKGFWEVRSDHLRADSNDQLAAGRQASKGLVRLSVLSALCGWISLCSLYTP